MSWTFYAPDGSLLTQDGGGASALDDLTDVAISSPAATEVLQYNGSRWVNVAAPTGSGAGDATLAQYLATGRRPM